jgi:ribosome-associated heat shock protein Hsp15
MLLMESTRVDRWLWSVRAHPSRSAATTACQGGHVRVNGRAAKPSTSVSVGDRVEVTVRGVERVLEVTRVIDRRVGAPVAAECYVDHSPPPPPRDHVVPLFSRDRGSGRPSKKERRQLDRFRHR